MCQNNDYNEFPKSLLEGYQRISPYYQDIKLGRKKEALLSDFSPDNASEFINSYFMAGNKEHVFDISFIDEYLSQGKHQHSVSLYFLGEHLREIIDTRLESKLSEITVISTKKNMSYTYLNLFGYIWFLTCLFHDTASAIETEKTLLIRGNNLDLDFYLGEHNIKYNVFYHQWKNAKPYNYSQSLVKNYFKYRLDHSSEIDHGILAGFLLYDRLRVNYDEAYKKYKKSHKYNKYNNFKLNNLNWAAWHHDYFAYAAHSIIGHNMWFSKKKELYEKYGLSPLIIPQAKKINIDENPLLFYLGVLDTIEPLKKFLTLGNDNAKEILESINITTLNNEIKIKTYNKISTSYKNEYKKWLNSIYSLTDWLDLEINPNKKEEVQDCITLKLSSKQVR